MMHPWQEVRARYASEHRAGRQNDEDSIATAILSGLGVPNPRKNLCAVESRVYGGAMPTLPLIERAIKLHEHAFGSGMSYNVQRVLPNPCIVVLGDEPTRDTTDTAIMSLLSGNNPVFCWRSATPFAQWMTLAPLGSDVIAPLQVFQVGACDHEIDASASAEFSEKVFVIRQPVKAYIQQGGPYDFR